ncbi:Lon protease family protein [Haliea sp.]|uniref:Lon protease family protein n=1 Tax=Haliea sp. TaxID=1932666 RepID=UPI003529689A
MLEPLAAEQIYRACSGEGFDFTTTEGLESLDLLYGHDRARDALSFGTAIRSDGFNLYVLGDPGHGRHDLVEQFLAQRAAAEDTPGDWAYRYNFDDPTSPRYLALPAGMGRQLVADLTQLVDELRAAIPALLESEEYQNRLQDLNQAMGERQRDAIEAIRREAREQDILLVSTPNGFTFAPVDGKADSDAMMSPEDFRALPKADKERIEATVEILQRKLTQAIRQMPLLARELRQQVDTLNAEMLTTAIGAPLTELEERYQQQPAVLEHLAACRQAVLSHAAAFLAENPELSPEAVFSRFQVNLLVDNAEAKGAPVVYQDLPSHQHLVGRTEHHVHNGTLVTDFSLIRAGALHRANGGYLVLDVRGLLTQPGAWETLKRVLRAGQIRTESLEQAYGLISTVSLEPEPIPLDVKVVLLGERLFYYLLCEHDPEFLELFKVQADLEDTLDRDPANQALYARMIATLARDAGLQPLDRGGVAAVIERASRLASDQRKLTARQRELRDLLREAQHWAMEAGATTIGREHVETAIEQQLRRASRLRERSHEAIHRGIVMIATQGEAVGQVNGLSVLSLGDFAFGQPSRITATARPGSGQLVDIEREARMGGRIHTKGVMIIARYLANRYAPDTTLSLSASLAFEQSYGGVDGDSASVAEICALVSAISKVPLKQAFAVTGSVNQRGEVQAVGGVNEKIEGFFDVCAARGEVDGHAVLLPASNVEHLMLKQAVRAAVEAGRFRIYAIHHVDDALTLLTGLEPSELEQRVTRRLAAFSAVVKAARADDDSAAAAAPSSEEADDEQ